MMDRAAFETEAARDRFHVAEVVLPPNTNRPTHTHEFDARLFILSGAFMLARDGEIENFAPGDICEVPAGTPHQEITDERGTSYLAGRRFAAQTQAAE
jgi:mannose-6-phosphate isomerase-like protein (cupin superfamily)